MTNNPGPFMPLDELRDDSSEHEPSAPFAQAPAAAVIAELLREQEATPARGFLARLFGKSPLSTESRPWYLGALGELEVGRRLKALDDSWTVLHAVPVGTHGSDIDHVIAGSRGVFTVNTKHHGGKRVWVGSKRILINGQKVDHLRNAKFEAERVRKALAHLGTVPVWGLLVIVGASDIKIKEQPSGVTVISGHQLIRWLRKRPTVLEPDMVGVVSAAIRAPDMWGPSVDLTVDELRAQSARFDELHREVRSAARVRKTWVLGGLVALIGFAWHSAVVLLGNLPSLLPG